MQCGGDDHQGRKGHSVRVGPLSLGQKDDWAAWKDGGRMSDDSGGVVGRSLMILGYLTREREW